MVPASLACPDWLEKLQRGETPIAALDLNQKKADHAARIFSMLQIPDVHGQPSMREAAGDWIFDIIRAVFGSVQDDLNRRIREYFILVPKKNSKTTTGAGIMLTALLNNERHFAEFILIGPTQAIAEISFRQAVGMIKADRSGNLQKVLHIQEHTKTITHRVTEARLMVKTFAADVMTGVKPVGVLVDELHLLGTKAKAVQVLQQITGGIIANPEGFIIYITTQSDSPPAGVFKSKLNLARAVRDGENTITHDLLPVLYEFPTKMQADDDAVWKDPKYWPLVLPNNGRSITVDRLVTDYEKAQAEGPEALAVWASQHLNIQLGIALNHEGWAGARYWPERTDDTITIKSMIERCEVITAGLDGGGLDDLFGLALIGREKETNNWLTWGRAWAQSDVLDLRKDISENLRDFQADGDLIICEPGDPLRDVLDVADILQLIDEAGLFPESGGIGVDPMGISTTVDELDARGIRDPKVCAVAQGFRLSSAVWGMERKLKDGTLIHADQELMTWCVGNARAEQRGNAIHITKQVAGKAKIDPLVAMFNAFFLMSRNPVAAGNMSTPWDEDENFSLTAAA